MKGHEENNGWETHYSGKEPDSGRVSSFGPSPVWVASEAAQALACLHQAWGKFLCVLPSLSLTVMGGPVGLTAKLSPETQKMDR